MYALPSLQEMLGAFLRTLTYKVAVCTPKSKKKKICCYIIIGIIVLIYSNYLGKELVISR